MGYSPDETEMLKNFRGRRFLPCRSISTLEAVIEAMKSNETKHPNVDPELPPPPSEQMRNELKNQARVLLRLILILNDGHVSDAQIRPF